MAVNMTFKTNLLPNSTTLEYSLGSEDKQWNIYGELNGNASSADKLKIARTLTIGGTGKDFDGSANVSWSLNEIGATVSNTWAAGTTAGPTITTTVNEVAGTPVAIPSASASASGIVTTETQTFAGAKTIQNNAGALYLSSTVTTRGTVPSTYRYGGVYVTDSTANHSHADGGRLGVLEAFHAPNGQTGIQVVCYPNTLNSTATNYIALYVTQDGTATYSLRSPAAFRTALGLGARATDNTAYLPLAGGTMTGAIQWNGRGQNSIYNGPNDQASGVGGTLNNLVISSWYGISFTTNCAGTYQGKNAVSINTRTGNVYANSFNGVLNSNANSIGSSWVDSRDKAAVNIDASDSSSSVAYSLCRIKFPSKTFAISSERANPQFGIYGWNNSRTENGYDWAFYLANNGYFYANTRIYGAVWNDYAEKRNIPEAQKTDWKDEECIAHPYAGRCVRENGDDTMSFSTERLQKGCKIISDTFGYCVGETDDCKTPIAVSGRALVYLLEDRETAKEHIGDFVCSGPNGTVSIMTTEEYFKCPQAVVGTISAVPDYEEWGTGHVKVDGRIWIYVR